MTIAGSEFSAGRFTHFPMLGGAITPQALIGEARQRQHQRRTRGLFASFLVLGAALVLYGALAGRASNNSTALGSLRSATSSSVTAGNPCAFLSNGQAAEVLGGPVTSRQLSHNGTGQLCTWAGPTSYGAFHVAVQPLLYVSVVREPLATFEQSAKAQLLVSGKTPGNAYSLPGTVTQVHGLAASAYYYPRGVGELTVWKNGEAIDFQPSLVVTSLTTFKSLATAALKHL